MPSSNHLDPFNINSSTVSLSLRRSYAERLRKSRYHYKKLFLKKVDQRSHIKGTQNSSKELSNPWITSGSLGSKECVLVFRTSVFNMQNDDDDISKNNGDDKNQEIPSTSSSPLPSSTAMATTASAATTKIINNSNNNINNNNHKEKTLYASLPKNINNDEPNKKCPNINSDNSNNLLDKKKLTLIKSPKKRLHNSLSSSENSISSSGSNDLPEDIDNDDNDNDDDEGDDDNGDDEDVDDNDDDGNNEKFLKSTTQNNLREKNFKININKKSELTLKNETIHRNNVAIATKHISSSDDKENINNTVVVNKTYDGFNISDMPAAKFGMKYKLMNTETRLLRKIFANHGLVEAEDDQQFNILWTGVHVKPDILRNLTPYQRVNHFPRSYELTRKDCLYKNIVKMQHLRGYKHFDIVPQSFLLPLEYRDLVTAHNKCRGPWIVKPAASSRGRGIFIVNSPDQIQTEEQVLVSKYISNPLCIGGNKCDVRVYVAVTSFDPLIIYMYEEGLVRLATVKYDKNIENLWNPCMHLCNYSINKYHSDYIKSSDAGVEDVGHKWTLSALLRHLKSQGHDIKQLMSNIEDLIIKSMFACAQSIISACRMFVPSGNNCFELYGFDILIDDTLKPWLLEINLSPSLGVDSPLDARVKASLITDLLTLIGVPAYSQAIRLQYDTRWTRFRGTCSSGSGSSGSTGRRANSADYLNGGKKNQSTKLLSSEEIRIVKNAKLQYARRGGFVRIFPNNESMQKYGSFLDPVTGVPLSINPTSGSSSVATFTMILPHNFNYLLHNQLFCCDGKQQQIETLDTRMENYERALEITEVNISNKKAVNKSIEECKRLRKQIRRLIENGNELTQLQARRAFGLYLEFVLRRLCQEPRNYHEKLILKFINRVSDTFRTPLFFHNPLHAQLSVANKDRSAMVAKLLGDFLESYNRDTEAYVDSFDSYGMIPIKLFNEFLSQAQESDLESVLTLHTNLTQSMPFLYNRCSASAPQTPPIPTGLYGFLKALPCMVPGGYHSRDQTKIDSYYKNLDLSIKDNLNSSSSTTVSGSFTTSTATPINDKTLKNKSSTSSSSSSLNYPAKKKIQQQNNER